jgi:ribosomal protein S18 acetylase RimI-like enzyme
MHPLQAASLRVVPVHNDNDYERFLSLPHEVYHESPYWVPPDPDFESAEVRGLTPFAEGVRLQPFIAERGGAVVARVLAVFDPGYGQHWGERAGHITMFEALPDAEAEAAAMLHEASAWLQSQDCSYVRAGFLIGWSMPFVIDAYHRRPTFLHLYNPPHYHGFLKNAGFATEKGVVEYQVRFTDQLAERYRAAIAAAAANGVTIRPWDFERMEQENARMVHIYNATFDKHWGAPLLTEAQFAGLTIGMKSMLVPGSELWAEVSGELAGGVYAAPDLNQAARGDQIDHGILLTIGVLPQFRGRGANVALGAGCFLAFMERGYKSASYTVVLDDNWPSRRTAEKLGCRVDKSFAVYRRNLRA